MLYLCQSINQLNYIIMGLDMYLYSTKKVDGLEVEYYEKVDNTISNIEVNAFESI